MLDTINPQEWNYIGSGSANVVLGYIGNNEDLKGMVVRLRLSKSHISTKEIYDYLNSAQFNELKRYIPKMTIHKVGSHGILSFQSILDDIGMKLSIKPTDEYVLLMRNIFQFPIQDYQRIELNKYYKFFFHKTNKEIVFELKPKWLYNLPEGYKTCRNCIIAQSKGQSFIICHLKLLGNENTLSQWCEEINNELKKRGLQLDLKEKLQESLLENHDLFKRIASIQNRINIHERLESLNSETDVNDELCFAMTIRDLSILIKLNTGETYIVDLDKKSSKKWRSWKEQELKIKDQYLKDLDFNCRFETNT